MNEIKIQTIEFEGALSKIPAHLMTPQNSSSKLAVVLPGGGYSYRQPLLHFSIQGLLAKGYRVLAFNKLYSEDPNWTSLPSESEARNVISEDAISIFKELKSKHQHAPNLVLGKSFGAYAAACAIDAGILKPQQIIWQTPALGDKSHIMRGCGIRGFGILGTADYYYADTISNLPDDRILIEHADHAMEIPGNPIESIKILQKVTQATLDWINDLVPTSNAR